LLCAGRFEQVKKNEIFLPMSKYVIIYDGNCRFCLRFVQWCTKINSIFKTLSVREKEAKLLLKEKGLRFIDLQTIYFLEDDKILVRSKAIFAICRKLKYPWKLLAIFEVLPTPLTDYFYRLFAKFRYSIM